MLDYRDFTESVESPPAKAIHDELYQYGRVPSVFPLCLGRRRITTNPDHSELRRQLVNNDDYPSPMVDLKRGNRLHLNTTLLGDITRNELPIMLRVWLLD